MAGFQDHHERQPGRGELAAEPVMVSGGTVSGHRAECETRSPGPDREIRVDRQLGAERRIALPLREVPSRVLATACTGVIEPFSSPQRGEGDHAVVPSCRTGPTTDDPRAGTSRRPCGPRIIDHQHPRIVRRGRRVRQQQLRPAGIDQLSVHRDSDRKNCKRCNAGCCTPATGSAPAKAVSVICNSAAPAARPGNRGTPPLRQRAEQVIKPRRISL